MLIAVLFIITKIRNQSRQLSMEEYINEMYTNAGGVFAQMRILVWWWVLWVYIVAR